jgi:hypothetical protein
MLTHCSISAVINSLVVGDAAAVGFFSPPAVLDRIHCNFKGVGTLRSSLRGQAVGANYVHGGIVVQFAGLACHVRLVIDAARGLFGLGGGEFPSSASGGASIASAAAAILRRENSDVSSYFLNSEVDFCI